MVLVNNNTGLPASGRPADARRSSDAALEKIVPSQPAHTAYALVPI